MKTLISIFVVGLALPAFGEFSTCRPWARSPFKSAAEKACDKVTPIEKRMNRPFHFYGNAVRRKIDKGYVIPRPVDVRDNLRALRFGHKTK